MREIKFRAKRPDNNEWEYGMFANLHIPSGDRHNNEHEIVPSIFNDAPDGHKSQGGYWKTVDPDTVGQYTGLKDKNGKEIYEGDFIKKDYPFEGVYLVKYDEVRLMWKFCMSENFWLSPNDEIIGNIHDNPELLEEPKEQTK